MAIAVIDFPEPDSPTNAQNLSLVNRIEIPSSGCTEPMDTDTLCSAKNDILLIPQTIADVERLDQRIAELVDRQHRQRNRHARDR